MGVNIDKMKQKEEELNRLGRKFWTPKDGKNRVRIVPPPEGIDEFYGEGGFHYHVGSGDSEKTFPCPRLGQEREDCWLCAKVAELEKGDDEDHEEAEEMRAGRKYIIPILDLEHPELGIQFWLAGFRAFKATLTYFTDEQYGDISDPDTGYNLTVTKSGKGLKTEYEVRCDKNDSIWPKDFDSLLEDVVDPWSILTYATNSEMEAAYNGTVSTQKSSSGRNADKDDEDAKPTSRRASRGTSERSRPPRGEAPGFDDEEKKDAAAEPEDGEDATEAEEPETEPAKEPVARHRERRDTSSAAPTATRAARPDSGSRRLGRELRGRA